MKKLINGTVYDIHACTEHQIVRGGIHSLFITPKNNFLIYIGWFGCCGNGDYSQVSRNQAFNHVARFNFELAEILFPDLTKNLGE